MGEVISQASGLVVGRHQVVKVTMTFRRGCWLQLFPWLPGSHGLWEDLPGWSGAGAGEHSTQNPSHVCSSGQAPYKVPKVGKGLGAGFREGGET